MASNDTPTYTRQYGRLHYKSAASMVRKLRRDFDGYPEVAETQASAFAAMFSADAKRAGDEGHFAADTFIARTQLLPAEQLAEIKAAKVAKFLADHPEMADLESEFGGTEDDETDE